MKTVLREVFELSRHCFWKDILNALRTFEALSDADGDLTS